LKLFRFGSVAEEEACIVIPAAIHALLPIDFAHGVRFLHRVLLAGHELRNPAVELNYRYQ
jgi:hypothetical protein